MAATELPSASLLEDLRFNQAVIVPNALQGLFKRRRRAVAAATALNVDGQAVGLLAGLKRRHGGRPVWVRVVTDRALLLLDVEDVRLALDGSPDPFASDPDAKRKGMSHFQPDALTISRGELWAQRRPWTEAVLETPEPVHRLAPRFAAVVGEEVGGALDGGELDYDSLHAAYRRMTRRIVLGDDSADDEELSDLLGDLMEQANGRPSSRSDEFEPFMAKLERYLETAPPDSLAGLAAQTPATPDTKPAGQLSHWLFATQDTLSANVMRALAVLAVHPDTAARARDDDAYRRAALMDTMRLWPTTPLLSRETLKDLVWHGVRVPAGTNVLISNVFMHRDRERLGDAADRFTPEGWLAGGALADDWGLNHFSHGPQGCPGTNLALFMGAATIATVLQRGALWLANPSLDAGKPLPHMLDFFAIRLSAGER